VPLPHLQTTADLDGSPGDELLIPFLSVPGGSGTFLHLAVIRNGLQGPEADFLALGDRVQVLALEAKNGVLALLLLEHGPGDAACCPTHKVLRRWQWEGDGLVERPPEPRGRVSVAELAGRWRLTAVDGVALKGKALLLTIEGVRLSGRGKCNRFSGRVRVDASDGRVHIGPLTATRMSCPEAAFGAENRLLETLSAVTAFHRSGPVLILSWNRDGKHGMLRFERMSVNEP